MHQTPAHHDLNTQLYDNFKTYTSFGLTSFILSVQSCTVRSS